ncbi:hypothetical protein HZS_5987 [Henneguya salminicola]|nr:hypothetical protein HZS_5987 [Henneguya salminicola]
MTSIFLQEWKTLKPFLLEVRKRTSAGFNSYFGIHLYRRELGHYIIDFHMLTQPSSHGDDSSAHLNIEQYLGYLTPIRSEVSLLTSISENHPFKKEKICNSMEFLTLCGDLIIELSG